MVVVLAVGSARILFFMTGLDEWCTNKQRGSAGNECNVEPVKQQQLCSFADVVTVRKRKEMTIRVDKKEFLH